MGMDLPTSTPEPDAGSDEPDDFGASSSSRSRMLTVGLPAVLAVMALAGVTSLVGSGDDAVRTGDSATTSTTSTTTGVDDFTSAGVSVDSTATPTTPDPTTAATTATSAISSDTTTTLAPATTLVPSTPASTLPAQPSEPIAPPPDPRGYEDQIQLGGLSIPKLGLDAPLLEGIRLTTLDNGPGHWPGTAMPGEVGNVVVAAHRTSHSAEFRNIDQLDPGDSVMFNTEAGAFEYKVTGTQIVNPDAIWIVDPTDTPTATLFACHPPGSVAQRIVVTLELAS